MIEMKIKPTAITCASLVLLGCSAPAQVTPQPSSACQAATDSYKSQITYWDNFGAVVRPKDKSEKGLIKLRQAGAEVRKSCGEFKLTPERGGDLTQIGKIATSSYTS